MNNKNYKRVIDFLGIRLDNLTSKELLDHIDYCIEKREPCHVVGLNVDQAVRVIEDQYSHEIFDNADIVFTDGKPIVWMTKWLNRPVVEKISGPDLLLLLCERAAQKGYKVFFLGGRPMAAERTAANLKDKFPNLDCVGTYSPSFGFENKPDEMRKIIQLLRKSKADQLFVGLGSPKQDIFIYENMKDYNIPVSYSMGAALDYISGSLRRAPKFMSDHGMEWLYRFIQEPRRMFKRYFITDIRIVKYFFKYKKSEKKLGKL